MTSLLQFLVLRSAAAACTPDNSRRRLPRGAITASRGRFRVLSVLVWLFLLAQAGAQQFVTPASTNFQPGVAPQFNISLSYSGATRQDDNGNTKTNHIVNIDFGEPNVGYEWSNFNFYGSTTNIQGTVTDPRGGLPVGTHTYYATVYERVYTPYHNSGTDEEGNEYDDVGFDEYDREIASTQFTLTVSGNTTQTISFPAVANHIYGDAPFTLSASSSSGLPVTYAVTSGPATVSGNTVTLTGAGTVTIAATQLGNATFGAASVSRTFSVAKANQTVIITSLLEAPLFAREWFYPTASVSSGLPATFSVSGPASFADGVIMFEGAGSVTITATQAGSANYNAVTVSRTITVLPCPVSPIPAPTALVDTNIQFNVTVPTINATTVTDDNGNSQSNYWQVVDVVAHGSGFGSGRSWSLAPGTWTDPFSFLTVGKYYYQFDYIYSNLQPYHETYLDDDGVEQVDIGIRANPMGKRFGWIIDATFPVAGPIYLYPVSNHYFGDPPFKLRGLASDGYSYITYRVLSGPAMIDYSAVNGGTNPYASDVTLTGPGHVVVAVYGTGGASYQREFDVLVRPPTITLQPVSQSTIPGANISLQVIASGSQPLTYLWRKNGASQWSRNGTSFGPATGQMLYLPNVQGADAGTYSVVVSNSAGSVTSANAVLDVDTNYDPLAPHIITQPVSQTVSLGQSVTFDVGHTGIGPMTYQWKKNGSPIAGQTLSLFSINSVVASDAAVYSLTITNAYASVTSATVTLTINGVTPPAVPLSITQHPQDKTVAAGATVTLTAGAYSTVTPIGFQWQKYGLNSTGYAAIPGATSPTLTLSNVQASDFGYYRLKASNPNGSVISNPALLSVTNSGDTNLLPSITTQPQSQTVAGGDTVTFTAAAASQVGPLTYRWRKNGADIAGATATSLTIANVQSADAGSYTFVATNSNGSATSNTATLTVSPAFVPLQITQDPSSQSATGGATVTFSAAAYGTVGPINYQWRKNGGDILGATNSTLTLANVQAADEAAYTLGASNNESAVESRSARLAVVTSASQLAPVIVTAPMGTTAQIGSTAQFSVVATGTGPLDYQWQKDGTDISGATSASLNVSVSSAAAAGNYWVTVTNSYGAVRASAPLTAYQPAPGGYVAINDILYPGWARAYPRGYAHLTGPNRILAGGQVSLRIAVHDDSGLDLPFAVSLSLTSPNGTKSTLPPYAVADTDSRDLTLGGGNGLLSSLTVPGKYTLIVGGAAASIYNGSDLLTFPLAELSFEVIAADDNQHGADVIAAKAAPFYISSSDGNDANDGRSATAAWRSLAKINTELARQRSNGEPVGGIFKLKRGDRWNQYEDTYPSGDRNQGNLNPDFGGLAITDSGSPAYWITICTYGTGAKPLIVRNSEADPYPVPSPSAPDSTLAMYGILLDGANYVRVQDLQVKNAYTGLLAFNRSEIEDRTGLEIVGCDFANMNSFGSTGYGAGIRLYGTRGFGNVGVSGACTFDQCFVGFSASTTTGSTHNLTARDCSATNSGSGGVALWATDHAYIFNWTIGNTGKEVSHPGPAGIYLDGCRGISVKSCTITDVQTYASQAQSDGSAVAIEAGKDGYGSWADSKNNIYVSDIMVVDCTLQKTDGPAVSFLGSGTAINVLVKGNHCYDNNRVDNSWIQLFDSLDDFSEEDARAVSNATFTTFQWRPWVSSIRFVGNDVPQTFKTDENPLGRSPNNVGVFNREYYHPADRQWHGFGTVRPVQWIPNPY